MFKVLQTVSWFIYNFMYSSSLYLDEDGDLAHEFYEETIVTKNGRKRAKLKRIQKNLIPQVCSQGEKKLLFLTGPDVDLAKMYHVKPSNASLFRTGNDQAGTSFYPCRFSNRPLWSLMMPEPFPTRQLRPAVPLCGGALHWKHLLKYLMPFAWTG